MPLGYRLGLITAMLDQFALTMLNNTPEVGESKKEQALSEADDSVGRDAEPNANIVGVRSRIRRDEADRCSQSLGGMITSSVHVLILVAVFFAKMKERTLKIGRNVGDGDAVGMRPYRIIRFSPAGEVYRVRSVNSCGDFSLR